MTDHGTIDPSDIPRAELRDAMWRAGRLEFLMDSHQLETHVLFEEWNERRLTPEYESVLESSGATLDDVWVEEIGRRFGKTSKWLLVLASLAIKRPGAALMYGTAWQKDIAEIIVPLSRQLFATAPDDVRPKYQRSKADGNEGLYFPNGSAIKLVGLDQHPDAARGRYSDGIVLSEAGFMKDLESLCRAVLLPQFQRRPWAFLALETSTPKMPDHDFLRVFVPDAQLRGAYVMRTLDHNTAIGEREKAKAIREAGGRGHPTCEREYYCVQTRDPEDMVIPEFTEEYVYDWKRPDYALTMTAADPGMQDLFGQVWGYYDFLNDRIVIEASWAERNASTRKVACVNAAYEFALWGTWPAERMAGIPVRSTERQLGWVDLLRGTPHQGLAPMLHKLANTEPSGRPQPGVHPWPTGLQYWNGERFRMNPYMRVSDIELRLIADLKIEWDLEFVPTRKDDRDSQINLLRDRIADGKIVFLPGSGPVIPHVKNAMWNERRTDFERHKVFGHYDCLAALIYFVRNVDVLKAHNPKPPKHTDLRDERVASFPWTTAESRVGGLGELASLGGRIWR